MPEKKPNTYKKDWNGELQSEKYGYNKAIDELSEKEVIVDVEALSKLLWELDRKPQLLQYDEFAQHIAEKLPSLIKVKDNK